MMLNLKCLSTYISICIMSFPTRNVCFRSFLTRNISIIYSYLLLVSWLIRTIVSHVNEVHSVVYILLFHLPLSKSETTWSIKSYIFSFHRWCLLCKCILRACVRVCAWKHFARIKCSINRICSKAVVLTEAKVFVEMKKKERDKGKLRLKSTVFTFLISSFWKLWYYLSII